MATHTPSWSTTKRVSLSVMTAVKRGQENEECAWEKATFEDEICTQSIDYHAVTGRAGSSLEIERGNQ